MHLNQRQQLLLYPVPMHRRHLQLPWLVKRSTTLTNGGMSIHSETRCMSILEYVPKTDRSNRADSPISCLWQELCPSPPARPVRLDPEAEHGIVASICTVEHSVLTIHSPRGRMKWKERNRASRATHKVQGKVAQACWCREICSRRKNIYII
jgi:hypothetical protein